MTTDTKKQITVISGKGGTGKTTITAALAQLSSPFSVLADCDVDAPNLHLLLDPENISSEQFMSGKLAIKNQDKCTNCGKCLEVCRFEAITTDLEIDTIRCEGCGACAWICSEKAINMEIQPSGMIYEAGTRFGSFIHAQLDIGAENSGKLVSEVIQKSHKKAHQLNKELVIIDGSPGIACPVIASLTNAKLVLIVVEPTATAIHDMKRTLELVDFFKLEVAIVINKSTINEEQRENIVMFCNEEQIPIVGELPYDKEIYQAMVNGQTILEYKITQFIEPFNEMWRKIQKILDLQSE
ncbi:MAG: ATP-binding protein [Candidatus Hodarchaeales archaeon]